MKLKLAACFAAAWACAAPALAQTPPAATPMVQEVMANGNRWVAERPANWNGVLLLFSHGWTPQLSDPASAPPGLRDWLLAKGYALAASSYSKPGWALEQAVPDQIATIDAFTARFGKPRQVIAWGDSMGGLLSVALAERHPDRIHAALPACASISGAVGMMNQALDGAFVMKTLLAPASDLRLVRTQDDRANGAKAQAVVDKAQATPQGRARLTLASVLAGLPGWTDPASPEPAATDFAARQAQAAKAFVFGVFLPRAEQETRAGGAFSWNNGVDYAAQLDASGRRADVDALYAAAGLDLGVDLAVLAKTARIKPERGAVSYMLANYTPSGAVKVPVLTLHEVGDGMTIASNARAYAEAAADAGAAGNVATAWVQGAGHCRFTPAERAGALLALEQRLKTGGWSADPGSLNAAAAATGLGSARFTDHTPPPFLRTCRSAPGICTGG